GGSVLLLFQAEDGIRAFHVTGVQTCALPIWAALGRENPATLAARDRSHELSSQILKKAPSGAFLVSACQPASHFLQTALPFEFRSEERRVGEGVGLGVTAGPRRDATGQEYTG